MRLSHIAGSLAIKLCVGCVGAYGSKVSNKHRNVDRQYTHNYHRKARSPGCTFGYEGNVPHEMVERIKCYIDQVRARPGENVAPPPKSLLHVTDLSPKRKRSDEVRNDLEEVAEELVKVEQQRAH